MRKILTLLCCLAALVFRAPAQHGPFTDSLAKIKALPPAQQARLLSDLMKTRLSLSAAQYQRVSAINTDLAIRIQPIIHSDASRFSKARKIRPILEEKEVELKTVLTAAQFSTYETVKQEMIDKVKATPEP
jgi:hypothetical protein